MRPKSEKRQRVAQAKAVFTAPVSVPDDVFAKQSELAVCGCVLRQQELFPVLDDMLQPADFSDLFCGYFWHACEQISDRGEGIDEITVFQELEKSSFVLKGHDLMQAIATLHGAVADINNAEDYARSIREAALKLRIMKTGEDMLKMVVENKLSADGMVDEVNRLVFAATDQRGEPESQMRLAMDAYFSSMELKTQNGVPLGMMSGFAKLDDLLRGFSVGEVAILAGSEGMGKTSLLLSMARFMVKVMKRNVVYFSLEMMQEEILRAFMAMESGIPKDILKAQTLEPGMWKRFVDSSAEIASWPMHIVDQFPSLTPIQLRRKLRKIMSQETVDMVIVDGLWLMDANEPSKEGRHRDVFHIMRDLNTQAREFQVPYLVAHQYRSDIGNRGDKRPSIYDMSESAGVRRNAQVILGLYRDSHYNFGGDDTTRLYVLKDRNGRATGQAVELEYDAQRSCYLGGADANRHHAK